MRMGRCIASKDMVRTNEIYVQLDRVLYSKSVNLKSY